MEENKMSKQTVPLDVGYSSKKEGKSNAIILKLRKGKMEWVLYDFLDKEQLKLILDTYLSSFLNNSNLSLPDFINNK